MLKYARIKLFYFVLRPYQKYMRGKRAKVFSKLIPLWSGMKILDLGGTPEIWEFIDTPLDITMLNLDFEPRFDPNIYRSHHALTFVKGDACDTTLASNSFDLVFSNSVIEHVGDAQRQQAFARQVQRLAPNYWVQTPAKWFPIEAHSGMPFWWFYPQRLRQHLLSNWRKKLPEWTAMVETTALVERKSLAAMFPGAGIHAERAAGIVKSYIVCRVSRRVDSATQPAAATSEPSVNQRALQGVTG